VAPRGGRTISKSLKGYALRGGKAVEVNDPDELTRLIKAGSTRLWIDLTDPSPETVEQVGRCVGLHPLVAEDIIESNERSKVEFVDGIIHVVMYALIRPKKVERLEIDFALGRNFLLSVHPTAWDPMSAHQMKQGVAKMLERGPDFLLWGLVDGIVDGYFPIFDALADEIDRLQDDVVNNAVPTTLEHIFRLKTELVSLRHVIAPSREVFSQLTSREFDLIADAQVFYFRDVYDHLIRLTDEFDSFRELVAGTLEVYLSTINNNLSVIMKRLTGVTVVLAGIAAVGGLFGMSEAGPAFSGQEQDGFWIVVVASIVLAAVAVGFLRKIDWL
jgi:magnesium transporter